MFSVIQQITAAPPSLDPSANRYVVLPEDTPVGKWTFFLLSNTF